MRTIILALATLLGASCSSGPHPQGDSGTDQLDASADAAPCTAPGVTGCACAPVTGTAGGRLATSRALTKLVADPKRCLIYALAGDAILVFDTKTKTELAPIPLASPAIDFDVAHDGTRMVVAHRLPHALSVIDLEPRVVSRVIPISTEPGSLEVTSGSGPVYYVNYDQFSSMHRLDLTLGTDTILGINVGYRMDLELSNDETRLYAGDSASSRCVMRSFDITSGGFVEVSRTHWNHNEELSTLNRHLLATSSNNLYYAAHQWRAGALDIVTGGTTEDILAEDDAGTLAIGTLHAWDVALSAVTIAHENQISAATFAAAGQEAWMYSSGILGGVLIYESTSQLRGPHPLGVRDLPPAALSTYTIDQLVHDPVHGTLYARDAINQAIVVIDATTLQPTREIRVGSEPSDMALDSSGSALYVGHGEVQAIARIDLATATFDKFIQTPRLSFQIEAAGVGRVITADRYYDSAPTLFDVGTGSAAPTTHLVDFASMGVTADGATLFAASSMCSPCPVFRFAIGPSNLTLLNTLTTTQTVGGPLRLIVPHPLGSSVFFGNASLDATTLAPRYPTTERVLSISPDGRVALSASSVISVATGAVLGALPIAAQVQAVNANSHTAYLWTGSTIMPISLDAYGP